jgi:hypothetical protein
VSFVLVLIVPIVVGLAGFYGWLRREKPPAEARADWWRFARIWTSGAAVIVVAAELIRH